MIVYPSPDTFSVHVDQLIYQLDNIVGRLTLADPILRLERETEKWWVVVDVANLEQVMVRADRPVCKRFIAAFVQKHPETRIESSGNDEPTNDAAALSAGADASTSPVPQAVFGEPASPFPDTPSNVYPIREGAA